MGKKGGQGFYDDSDAGKTLWPGLVQLFTVSAGQSAQPDLMAWLMFAQANEPAAAVVQQAETGGRFE